MNTILANGLLGLAGLLIHVYVKYIDSSKKSNIKMSIWGYVINNWQRLLVAILGYGAVFGASLLSLNNSPLVPDQIKKLFTLFDLKDFSFAWIALGYLSDSIIRNISKIFLKVMESINNAMGKYTEDI